MVVAGGLWLGGGLPLLLPPPEAGGPAGARGLFVAPAGWAGRPPLAAALARWAAAPWDRLPPEDQLLHLLLG